MSAHCCNSWRVRSWRHDSIQGKRRHRTLNKLVNPSATLCRTSKVARAASCSLRFIPRALGPIKLAHREDHAGKVSDREFCDGWSSNSTLNYSTAARTTGLPWRVLISETPKCAGFLTVVALACCRCLPDMLPIRNQCRYLSLDLQVQTSPSVTID